MNVEGLIDTLAHYLKEAEVKVMVEDSREQYKYDAVLEESSCGKFLYIKQGPKEIKRK